MDTIQDIFNVIDPESTLSQYLSKTFDPSETIGAALSQSINTEHYITIVDMFYKKLDLDTLLVEAASAGNPSAVVILLVKGANANCHNGAPLIKAVLSENITVVEILLNHGAYIDLHSVDGRTALIEAIQFNKANLDIIKLLIKKGANVNHITADGLTPLDIAARLGSVKRGRILISNGATSNNARQIAVDNGRTKFLRLFN